MNMWDGIIRVTLRSGFMFQTWNAYPIYSKPCV